ncbi:MAG: methyl-accepting chemotaxis protein [Lachnospiraceae bacterium]|nr:methyl-accepting chemotaxis protein [Lachnospiraceae bacterium]MDE6251279.1 methyl-accepting chemotaxis protein [Lachnospiraceae bacterium]
MKKKSILKQLLFPIIAIVCALSVCLSVIIVVFFTKSYEQEIVDRNQSKSRLVSGEISTFLDGAYSVTEELSVNPSILTMDTKIQTPILEDCVARNSYLELLYIQGTDGMQTGRSSGELADRSTRWWFTQTMEEQKSFISKSYYSVNTGMPCASIFFPMYNNKKLVGIFAVDLKLDYLQSQIEEFSNIEKGEYSYIIDGEGVVVAHPDSTQIEELYNYKTLTKTVADKDEDGNSLEDKDGNILTKEEPFTISKDYQSIISDVMEGNTGCRKIKNDGEVYIVSYASIDLPGESDPWSVITVQKKSSAMEMVNRIIVITVFVAFLAIAVAIFVISLLAHRLTKPIVSITELIGNASDGDFTVRADESIRNEIGILSGSFNKMIEKVSGILTKITTFSGEVVQSSGYLKGIEEKADSINQAVREISDGAVTQNTQVNEVVDYTEELEEKFAELRRKSEFLLEDAAKVTRSGKRGSENVDELKCQNEVTTKMVDDSYEKIMSLGEQSQKISSIINTINDISSQTALLALNASIEAARAGEHGRGFAVVAESISKLAYSSTEATEDIEKIIAELCLNISDTVSKMESIKQGVDEQTAVVDKVQEAFSSFNELAEKTRNSVNGIEKLVVEMQQCDQSMVNVVEQIRNISENTAELTQKVADSLDEQLEGIRYVAGRIDNLSTASEEMEQDMTKFKMS